VTNASHYHFAAPLGDGDFPFGNVLHFHDFSDGKNCHDAPTFVSCLLLRLNGASHVAGYLKFARNSVGVGHVRRNLIRSNHQRAAVLDFAGTFTVREILEVDDCPVVENVPENRIGGRVPLMYGLLPRANVVTSAASRESARPTEFPYWETLPTVAGAANVPILNTALLPCEAAILISPY
jgi:hypothetical protein